MEILVSNQYTTITGEILEQDEISKYISPKDVMKSPKDVMKFLYDKYAKLKLSKKRKKKVASDNGRCAIFFSMFDNEMVFNVLKIEDKEIIQHSLSFGVKEANG